MLSSSPIIYPATSSPPPPAPKRALPHSPPKSRVTAPFLIDADSDSDSDNGNAAHDHPPKRRMLMHSLPLDQPPAFAPESHGHVAVSAERQLDTTPIFSAPLFPSSTTPLFPLSTASPSRYTATTCSGTKLPLRQRPARPAIPYESIIAARSTTREGRAKRSYYGIDIYNLLQDLSTPVADDTDASLPPTPSTSRPEAPSTTTPPKRQLWSEKYRARCFMDLCGDDASNRIVLGWLKKWDPLVFPALAKQHHHRHRPPVARPKAPREQEPQDAAHKKVLLLAGPPGLGKTTLAHVCARQAGYEVLEINASDDRSRHVVRNQIRTSLGTQSVKTLNQASRVARPVCVVVDEVDGAVSGSAASGEGGFVKALVDLVNVDENNNNTQDKGGRRRGKNNDSFQQMRPLILICNDVYHASLRPLRQSNVAQVVHVGRPSLDAVVARLKAVFEREGIRCDKDAARKLCEAAWGISSSVASNSPVDGDLRAIMVLGEWVAGRLRASTPAGATPLLTRHWIERHLAKSLARWRSIQWRVRSGVAPAGVEARRRPATHSPSTMMARKSPSTGLGCPRAQRRP
ncbi:hypothetical protein CDD82_7658 [Ophiocordyceps australis]|uniref:AAA+ ATPase domain-containing protein n=1 Tax=Ophiocordyceps australis TaxID=1399860 RepID=A0A2C5YPE3_9HYPO|nr:hypothetical protein CDD82_7658 [Ophiocordyceps australis]